MTPLISADGISKSYNGRNNARVEAVRDVTLTVGPGDIVLVSGPNGSGKTTLLSMLGCMIPPTTGRIILLGTDVCTLSQKELIPFRLEHIGFVFQAFRLLDALSVVENVEIPLNLRGVRRPASAKRALEILGEFHLDHRAADRTGDLSGGQRQRVAIARALANDPSIILADEPTGSLDSEAGREVIELLRTAAHTHGKGVLMVSHDPRIECYADRVIRMEDGRFRGERGDHESF